MPEESRILAGKWSHILWICSLILVYFTNSKKINGYGDIITTLFSVSFAQKTQEDNLVGDKFWKNIWNYNLQPKINCFQWVVAHRKILMLDNLSKHGLKLANICALCKKDVESINHLLLHYFGASMKRDCSKDILFFLFLKGCPLQAHFSRVTSTLLRHY